MTNNKNINVEEKAKKKKIRKKKAAIAMEIDNTSETPTSNKDDTEITKKKSRKRKAEDCEMEVDDKPSDLPISFPPAKKEKLTTIEMRKLVVPSNRLTPLKEHWISIYTPVAEKLKLQIRYNMKARTVEMRNCKETEDPNSFKRAPISSKLLYGFVRGRRSRAYPTRRSLPRDFRSSMTLSIRCKETIYRVPSVVWQGREERRDSQWKTRPVPGSSLQTLKYTS
ncbi:UNVERIFIED_CONTAM: hypothetical protein GTU68_035231 [Idotea baltica]|nr:hypothetical protein [Idotea baltica]